MSREKRPGKKSIINIASSGVSYLGETEKQNEKTLVSGGRVVISIVNERYPESKGHRVAANTSAPSSKCDENMTAPRRRTRVQHQCAGIKVRVQQRHSSRAEDQTDGVDFMEMTFFGTSCRYPILGPRVNCDPRRRSCGGHSDQKKSLSGDQ